MYTSHTQRFSTVCVTISFTLSHNFTRNRSINKFINNNKKMTQLNFVF